MSEALRQLNACPMRADLVRHCAWLAVPGTIFVPLSLAADTGYHLVPWRIHAALPICMSGLAPIAVPGPGACTSPFA